MLVRFNGGWIGGQLPLFKIKFFQNNGPLAYRAAGTKCFHARFFKLKTYFMRLIQLILFLMFCAWLSSCASSRSGCPSQNYRNIQKHDAKRFRVIKMKAIGYGRYYVVAKRYFEIRKEIFSCKPMVFNDSILLN